MLNRLLYNVCRRKDFAVGSTTARACEGSTSIVATSIYKILNQTNIGSQSPSRSAEDGDILDFITAFAKRTAPLSESLEPERAQEDTCRGQKLESAEHHCSLAVPQAERERERERRKGAERTRLLLK